MNVIKNTTNQVIRPSKEGMYLYDGKTVCSEVTAPLSVDAESVYQEITAEKKAEIESAAEEIAEDTIEDTATVEDTDAIMAEQINSQLAASSVRIDKLKLLLNSIVVKDTSGNEVENGATIELPFKLGYKWQPVNNSGTVSYQMVKDDTAIGLEDNPIAFVKGVKLLPNAFYIYNGSKYVYMGTEGIAGEFADVENMAEW